MGLSEWDNATFFDSIKFLLFCFIQWSIQYRQNWFRCFHRTRQEPLVLFTDCSTASNIEIWIRVCTAMVRNWNPFANTRFPSMARCKHLTISQNTFFQNWVGLYPYESFEKNFKFEISFIAVLKLDVDILCLTTPRSKHYSMRCIL